MLYVDVVNLDIMLHHANTKKLFAANVVKWVICRKYAGANKANPHKPVNSVWDDEIHEYQLVNITSPGKTTPWNVSVDIEGSTVLMQLDTGALLSLMSESTFRELWPERNLSPSQVRLCSYSGEPIPVLGSVR